MRSVPSRVQDCGKLTAAACPPSAVSTVSRPSFPRHEVISRSWTRRRGRPRKASREPVLTETHQNEQHFTANGELSNYNLSHSRGSPQLSVKPPESKKTLKTRACSGRNHHPRIACNYSKTRTIERDDYKKDAIQTFYAKRPRCSVRYLPGSTCQECARSVP